MNWFIIIAIIVVCSILLFFIYKRQNHQLGGEYVHYTHLGPENSRRVAPLGYLSDETYVGPARIAPQLHVTPTRRHPRHMVHSDGRDDRKPSCNSFVYADQFDYTPYDFRPFEWRPFWKRRAHLEPSARTCSEYATDQCIGMGDSDYQSCYDQEYFKCPFPKDLQIVPDNCVPPIAP